MKTASLTRDGYEGLWLDFRDWFGILWTRRVMERLNQTAETEQLSARLSLDGLVWNDSVTEPERQETQEKNGPCVFAGFFRRFVDEKWIDERLKP